MSLLRTLPTAVLLLGLLVPLTAVAQSASEPADDDALFVLEGGPIDLTPTPEELAAIPVADLPVVDAAAGALAPSAFTTYPNPARDRATVRFTLDAAAPVRVAVYDLLGREVAVLVDGAAEAGTHEAPFDGSRLPSGLYLVRLETGGAVDTQRLTLTR